MYEPQKAVQFFQQAAQYPDAKTLITESDFKNPITLPTGKQVTLQEYLLTRAEWKQEELNELLAAIHNKDIIEIIDALVDILYFVFGTATTIGVDLQPFFEAVHAANMKKFGECPVCRGAGTEFGCTTCAGTGKHATYRPVDGKLSKPADWQPADLVSIAKSMYGVAHGEIS